MTPAVGRATPNPEGSIDVELVSVQDTPDRRVDLAAAYRLACADGFAEGICNHLTVKADGADNEYFVIPYGLHWSEVTASKLLRVTLEGEVIEGDGSIEPTALHIHSAIHLHRPDAIAVFHTHMPYATSLTTLADPRLLPISQNALRFYGRVAYEMRYAGAIDSRREGMALAESLQDKDVLFHSHHGVIVVGASVARAYDDLYYLERACQVQVLAMSTGRELRHVPENVASTYAGRDHRDVLEREASVHFEARKRGLAGSEPPVSS